MNHPVVLDYAGFGGRSRLTCYGKECNCATLLYQPWMSIKVWEEKVEEFSAAHPFPDLMTWAQYKTIVNGEKDELRNT